MVIKLLLKVLQSEVMVRGEEFVEDLKLLLATEPDVSAVCVIAF